MGKNNVMANRNNICTRFINYAAVLIFAFLSSYSFAYTGGGGDFGGGGAGGDWSEQCSPEISKDIYTHPHLPGKKFSSGRTACLAVSESKLDTSFLGSTVLSYDEQTGFCRVSEKYTYNPDVRNSYYITKAQTDCECPLGTELDGDKCVPKQCPAGQTLVNGQCKPKQCPAGQLLDSSGICIPVDDKCPAGQTKVNGRCTPDPDDPEPDPNSELPPFCEWASVMCQWHQEWQQWSNDYAANEQKANLDREELKRIGLDSKEYLNEIKINLDEIKQQDYQFYDELRYWLENFNPDDGTPSEQNPSIEFPVFCDWSVQICNWYLDWKDWRDDYNAHNELVIQKFNEHLQKLDEQKERDEQFYHDMEIVASNVVGNQQNQLNQDKEFQDDVRDFFDWYKDQADQNPSDPNDPNNPENQDGDVAVEQQVIPLDETTRINFVNACPSGEQFTVSFMGLTQNLEFSYQPLCQFMSMIRPFVIAIAYLIGAYILMGLSRGSSE